MRDIDRTGTKAGQSLAWSLILILALTSGSTVAKGFAEIFIDEDGWFDASQFLLDYPYGVLPLASVITEPAVGTGLVLAGAHFHERGEGVPEDEKDSKGRNIPRSVSAAALGATNNDTWFVGGGHFGYYKQGTVRYEGLLGYADVKLDFFGTSEEQNPDGFGLNAEAAILWQMLAFRLGDSNWFAGGAYRFMNTQTSFDFDGEIPGVEDDALDSNNAAIAVVLVYDSLDNSFTPSEGLYSDLQYARFDQAVGGDFDYGQLTWLNQAHLSFADDWSLGLRVDVDSVNGDAPFYAVPFINLKGIPAMRFQGENVISTEARLNWTFHPRWQVAGFVGAGRTTDDSFSDLGSAPSHTSKGMGFRYMAVNRLGINLGLDYAFGPEDSVLYVSVGTRL
jgi:hypothetical protein